MSTYFVPDDARLDVLAFVTAATGRTLHIEPTPGGAMYEFLPDLTALQETRLAELIAASRSRIAFTEAEYDLRIDIPHTSGIPWPPWQSRRSPHPSQAPTSRRSASARA
jgi:hypothetical protein